MIGSSLHVRIVAGAYGVARVALSPEQADPLRRARGTPRCRSTSGCVDLDDAVGAALAAGHPPGGARTASRARSAACADDNVRDDRRAGRRAGCVRAGARTASGSPPSELADAHAGSPPRLRSCEPAAAGVHIELDVTERELAVARARISEVEGTASFGRISPGGGRARFVARWPIRPPYAR